MTTSNHSEKDPERGKRLGDAIDTRNIGKMYVLSVDLGVSESTISRWRQGTQISSDNVIKLCRALDISADWLLLSRGVMEQHKAFRVSAEERRLLTCLRALPRDFRTHLMKALESLASR